MRNLLSRNGGLEGYLPLVESSSALAGAFVGPYMSTADVGLVHVKINVKKEFECDASIAKA